jgi:hypothetical protein
LKDEKVLVCVVNEDDEDKKFKKNYRTYNMNGVNELLYKNRYKIDERHNEINGTARRRRRTE